MEKDKHLPGRYHGITRIFRATQFLSKLTRTSTKIDTELSSSPVLPLSERSARRLTGATSLLSPYSDLCPIRSAEPHEKRTSPTQHSDIDYAKHKACTIA